MDPQTFLLQSHTTLVSHPLQLEIEGAQEAASGEITELLHYELANDEIYFPQSFAEDPNHFLLRFTDLIDPATSLQTSLYTINGQTPKDITISDNGYEISLMLEEALVLGEQIQVNLKSVKGISGKESQDLNLDQTYHDQINFIEVVDTKKIQLLHDVPLDREVADGLNFNILDETIDIAPQLDPEDAKILWLDFSPELTSDKTYHLEIPPRLGQRKQPISGSIRSFSVDTRPPEISDVEVLSADQIIVSFTEAIDSIMAIIPGHYLINNT